MVDTVKTEYFCKGCGNRKIDEKICKKCGCDKTEYRIEGRDEISIHDYVEGKVEDEEKIIIKFKKGDDLFRKTGTWNDRYMCANYKKDQYDEVIKDKNGEIIHECHEPLSKHIGHGYAKQKK